MAGKLVKFLSDLQEQEALDYVDKALEKGDDAMKILAETQEAMAIVGKKFASGEYFIPDLIFSGEILKQLVQKLEPHLKKGGQVKKLGKIIVGTVAGDIHDIGKDLVVFMLDVNGYEVTDLGIDVPVQKFVDAVKNTGSTVVALSGFLTLAFDTMKETVEALKKAGLRDKLKIMIGGGQIDETVRKYIGADAFGKDAIEAVKLANNWIGGK
jgi:methanogenic corrinoid protein MtbC1